MADISPADIEAFADVVAQITEQSDSTPLEEAAGLRLALLGVAGQVRDAVRMLETQMKNTLEEQHDPRRIGDRAYMVRRSGKSRFDHSAILARAADRARQEAINLETGEVATDQALERFAGFVEGLYVSPSVTAKVSGLKALGLDKKGVTTWEQTGTELVEIDLSGEGE